MAAIITNKLRIFNAQEFLQSINRSASIWQTATSYALGDRVVKDGSLWIALSSGTSGATGPTPTGLVDGNVTWSSLGQSVYNNLYMSIGKPTSWLNDANPPTPEDSIGYGYAVKTASIAMKKVGLSDMTLAIPRINWTSGSVYTMYEHDLAEEIIPNSYVLTEGSNQYNVYKCINNQKFVDDSTTSIAVQSTVKPTSTSVSEIETTSDGYKWKFMYSISLSDSLKFLTKDYIPVTRIQYDPSDSTSAEGVQWQIQQSALTAPGHITQVKILPNEVGQAVTGGSGYHANIVRSDITLSAGTVHTITGVDSTMANDMYKGYHMVDISKSPPEQGKILNSVVTGTTVAITLDTSLSGGPNSSIIIAPGVTINNGNGSGFSAYGTVANGKISNIVITNKGTNYTSIDSATIDTDHLPALVSGVDNANACKIKPIISPQNGHGFHAIEELGGYYIMIAMRLEYDEQHTRDDDTSTSQTKAMFPVSGDSSVFRQIAIVADPLERTSLIPATNVSYRGPAYTAPTADAWGGTNETTFDVESGSGKVLYTENRQPVSRAIDQIEDIKVVFEF
tara:strand:- start:1737 stop:3428 length:1692 start_codon:yes stop_codon:yes gene_type:complete